MGEKKPHLIHKSTVEGIRIKKECLKNMIFFMSIQRPINYIEKYLWFNFRYI